MNDNDASTLGKPARRPPWNKGKIIGAKPPLRQGHVWSIRTRLQLEKRIRDLALFNLAIDSKLRGCDVGQSASLTWLPAATHLTGPLSGKRRPADLCGSK
jgi:hypothetical protein